MECWTTLGIEPTLDKREIRRVYAKLIKENNPEDRPTEFQVIREAYDQALRMAEYLEHERQEGAESDSSVSPVEAVEQTRVVAPVPNATLSEKEKVRGVQDETIDVTLTKIIALLKHDEAAAVEFCRTTLRVEFYQALDVRYEFEGRLVLRLLQNDLYVFAFLQFLALEFNWDIDINRPERTIVSHFDSDIRYSGAFYVLVRPYVAGLIKQAMNDRLKSLYPKLFPDQIAQLGTLLFAENREAELAEFCKDKECRSLTDSAYGFLVAGRFIRPDFSVVPHKTVRWLIDNKIVRHIEPRASTSGTTERTGFRFSGWGIGIAIFILLRLLAGMGKESTSDQQQSPQNSSRNRSPTVLAEQATKLKRDAENGDLEAQYVLGLKYLKGDFVIQRDPEKGIEWLQRAAERGHAGAQESLGIAYYTGDAGVRDEKRAVEQLRLAADHDRSGAVFWLAVIYDQGRAVRRDPEKAREYLDRSVELGSTEGMRVKGLNLLSGSGEPQDIPKGKEYLERAAEGGNLNAAYLLAMEYLTGEYLSIDYQQAHKWLSSLSSKDVWIAQLWESQLYAKGLGVTQDTARSRQLLSSAERSAHAEAINEFSWQMAIHRNEKLRNGGLAVRLMEELLQNQEHNTPARIDTLAAAYAQAGHFNHAVRAQQRALDKLGADADQDQRRDYEARLQLYQRKQPYVLP